MVVCDGIIIQSTAHDRIVCDGGWDVCSTSQPILFELVREI